MKALIWKDLYCMRGFLKQVVATEAILLGIGVTLNNPAMIAFALLFLSLSLIQASMSVDEKNRWERYALTMPFSRRDMVASKYVLLTAIAVVMGILLMLLNMVLAAVRGEDLTATAAACSFSRTSFCVLPVKDFCICFPVPGSWPIVTRPSQ